MIHARRRIIPIASLLSSSSIQSFVSTAAAAMTDYPMILADRPTVCNLVPAGQCQFTPTFQPVPLLERIPCGTGGTSYILRFGLPDNTLPMGLTTCACILASAKLPDNTKGGEIVDVIRPYTPISANHQVGCFDLLIKDYGDAGYLSKYMCTELPIGGTVNFKHIDFNIKIPAPFAQKKIGMIAGGTGITPMIQALHAVLGDGPAEQSSVTDEVTLLYGSRSKDDVLGGEMLDKWASAHGGKFKHVDVLSHEPAESIYDGERGFINKEMIVKYLPPPSLCDDVVILVCGPPVMYNLLCGPRTEKEVTGILGELGYSSSQVFKF